MFAVCLARCIPCVHEFFDLVQQRQARRTLARSEIIDEVRIARGLGPEPGRRHLMASQKGVDRVDDLFVRRNFHERPDNSEFSDIASNLDRSNLKFMSAAV